MVPSCMIGIMFLYPRTTSRRGRLASILPWVLIVAVAAATTAPGRRWLSHFLPGMVSSPFRDEAQSRQESREEFDAVWKRSAAPGGLYIAKVLWTVDGDTFDARVAIAPKVQITTRVRLRGIDAPELKAACAREFQLAEAATAALRNLLRDGDVTLSNVGPDKYAGRIDADVSTVRTPNVSAALIAGGYVRRYDGGRRGGWC